MISSSFDANERATSVTDDELPSEPGNYNASQTTAITRITGKYRWFQFYEVCNILILLQKNSKFPSHFSVFLA